MQKTLIKSILAVAVAGTFASFASAAQTELYPFTKTFPKIGTIGSYAVCRVVAAGRR